MLATGACFTIAYSIISLTLVCARCGLLSDALLLLFLAFRDDLTCIDMLRLNCEPGLPQFGSSDCLDDVNSWKTTGSGRRLLPNKNSDRFADRFGPKLHHCTTDGVAGIV